MDKIKKIWKEISIFGIILVVFIGLYAYKKAAFPEYNTISAEKLTAKIENKDSFVVVVGSSSDTTTVSYQTVMQTFIEKNRDKTLYFVDLSTQEDIAEFIATTFDTEETSIPQTFIIKDGEVTNQKSGEMSYYRLVEFYNENK